MSKVTSLVDCTDEEAVECLNDFCESVQQEMTVNGSIPFSIPLESIAQLTKNAKTMFYKMYEDATEEMFIVLPREEIRKKTFTKGIAKMDGEGDSKPLKDTRGSFMLPDGVVSVVGVYEIGGFSGEAGWNTGLLGKYSGDISLNRMVYQSVYDRTMAVSADNMAYYICTEAFLDMSRQVFQNMISFRYNRLSKKIKFLGELPKSDVILDVLIQVSDCELFTDELFRRYVIADCKCALGRIIGSYNYSMPGNITLNIDSIVGDGNSEKEAVIQELKDISGNWYIMTT